jgi:uncharacterized membrane protein
MTYKGAVAKCASSPGFDLSSSIAIIVIDTVIVMYTVRFLSLKLVALTIITGNTVTFYFEG